jgi:plasmid stabilization system protein ParE
MAAAPRLHPDARAEVLDAAAYYRERGRALAERFLANLDRAMDRVLASPRSHRTHLFGTRRCLVARFPYLVVYRIREDEIHVIAIAHVSRKPGYWRTRLSEM